MKIDFNVEWFYLVALNLTLVNSQIVIVFYYYNYC